MERLIEEGGLAQGSLEEGLRFSRRMYLPRIFGLALGAVCIGGGLMQRGAHPMLWVALALDAFVWPHVAYRLASRSGNPYRAEQRNLMADSASGGFWIAAMGFNLVPSAVLFSMLAMDKVGVGGPKFLWRCLVLQGIVAAVTAAAFGFESHLESNFAAMVASLPLLMAYPIVVAITSYRLARRVRQQNQMLATLSSMDGLTGLLNRMHWEKAVAGEFARCKRTGSKSAVMMIDIDHFKAVNDEHGHLAGDEVIRSVAQILCGAMRKYDVAARYGGEEFGVVLSGSDIEEGRTIAERIRNLIGNTVLEARHDIRATVSIGVASFDPADADHASWIRRADEALYRAKAAGRNRTVSHEAALTE
ncbi:MAG TPA: diguanylate cyclase [Burkholderiales bacterium]|nr:diguanylate cyclase [Burkholderiales bacterium]